MICGWDKKVVYVCKARVCVCVCVGVCVCVTKQGFLLSLANH